MDETLPCQYPVSVVQTSESKKRQVLTVGSYALIAPQKCTGRFWDMRADQLPNSANEMAKKWRRWLNEKSAKAKKEERLMRPISEQTFFTLAEKTGTRPIDLPFLF